MYPFFIRFFARENVGASLGEKLNVEDEVSCESGIFFGFCRDASDEGTGIAPFVLSIKEDAWCLQKNDDKSNRENACDGKTFLGEEQNNMDEYEKRGKENEKCGVELGGDTSHDTNERVPERLFPTFWSCNEYEEPEISENKEGNRIRVPGESGVFDSVEGSCIEQCQREGKPR